MGSARERCATMWFRLDPRVIATSEKGRVRGAEFDEFASPLDLPRGIRGCLIDDDNSRGLIEFTYGIDEPYQRQSMRRIEDGIDLVIRAGKDSDRIYGFEFKLDPTTPLPENLRTTFQNLVKWFESYRMDEQVLHKNAIMLAVTSTQDRLLEEMIQCMDAHYPTGTE